MYGTADIPQDPELSFQLARLLSRRDFECLLFGLGIFSTSLSIRPSAFYCNIAKIFNFIIIRDRLPIVNITFTSNTKLLLFTEFCLDCIRKRLKIIHPFKHFFFCIFGCFFPFISNMVDTFAPSVGSIPFTDHITYIFHIA